MTSPRRVLPRTTYLVTRRCAQRQFLLRPSKLVNEIFGFVLAIAANRFNVQVHAFCVMSNHFHLVVTDVEARLPAFNQYLDSLVARALNASLGRWEAFWAPASYSAVVLESPADIVDKAAYVLANPVTAGLLRRGRKWPGLWSPPGATAGPPLEYRRPAKFFRSRGARALPERASLVLLEPPGFGSAGDYRAALERALEDKERAATGQVSARNGASVPGARSAGLAQTRRMRPEPRRALNPRVACRDKWKRIEALGRLVEFLRSYRHALQSWRSGDLAVVFPAGTYLMRVSHGVSCAALV
jgi:putative transposase